MLRIVYCLLSLVLFPVCGLANPPQNEFPAVASSLGLHFPNMPVKQISATPVSGVFEVVTRNEEYLYYAPAGGYLFTGELWHSSGKNLTRESKDRAMTAKLDMFPLENALKIGTGPNRVVEVSDPDCPFCRDGSAFFSAREDVTRYIFLYPLDRIHPQAEAKSRYILSAEDQEAAYEDVYGGLYDNRPLPEFKDNGLLDIHRQIAQEVGINSTPRYWINGSYISGTNLQEFEKILDKKQQ